MVFCLLTFSISWGLRYWYALVRTDNYLPPFNFSLIAQFGPSLTAVLLISITKLARQSMLAIAGICFRASAILFLHVILLAQIWKIPA